jgi:crotonobetainyl-CoA:carnitine CoA-transferase CaiB-like acyl-CoA transferase
MRPLEGITILDLTRLLPGAVATLLLQRAGAKVIKIEEPVTGDLGRAMPALFQATNGGKQSIAINLKSAQGHEQFLDLARQADVIAESFRPGVLDRLNLSLTTLHAANPRLIVASLYGYPPRSPQAQMAGHDLNYLAMAGALDDPPRISKMQIADIAAGTLPLVNQILLALLERHRTGQGARVEVNMVEGLDPLLILPRALASDHPLTGRYAFYNVYQCAGGRWIAVGALEPKFWQNLCRGLDRDDLAARQFDPDVVGILRQIFIQRTAEAWFSELGGKDCCLTPVLRLDETQPLQFSDGPAPSF